MHRSTPERKDTPPPGRRGLWTRGPRRPPVDGSWPTGQISSKRHKRCPVQNTLPSPRRVANQAIRPSQVRGGSMARRQRSERGAVAVEAALVTPLLMLLVFGIIEMSLLMRDASGVTNQVRAAARIAATEAGAGTPVSATTPTLADDAVNAIQNAGSSMPLSSV